MQEFQLIDKIFKNLTNAHPASLELANDTAKISLKKDEELLVSKDVFVEDVHFLRKDGGFKIASKLLRTNLSDLAASGAAPLYYMLGFSKNKNLSKKFFTEFARGLKSVQDEFGLCLIGGDTVSSEKLFFSVTIFGAIKKGKMLSRKNAKEGDLIYVSGSIGDAGLGLKLSKKSNHLPLTTYHLPLLNRHFFPTPRIKLGKKLLTQNLSTCAIDVSDGLLADLRHLCQTSKLDAEIFLEQIPISKSAQKFLEKNNKITKLDLLGFGDDYELIFSANPKNSKKIESLAKRLDIALTAIGSFQKTNSKQQKIILRDKENRQIKITKFGYEH